MNAMIVPFVAGVPDPDPRDHSRFGGRLARRLATDAVAIALLATACGGGASDQTTAATTEQEPPASTVAPTATPGTAAPTTTVAPAIPPDRTAQPTLVTADDPFGRTSGPPSGVAAQLELYVGGEGESCGVGGPLPYVALSQWLSDVMSDDAQIGFPQAICIEGYEVDVPITVDIVGPDGSHSLWIVTLASSGEGDPAVDMLASGTDEPQPLRVRHYIRWTPEPGSMLGEYTIFATQGAQSSSSGFTLVPASEERITPLSDDVSSASGGLHRFAFVGFPPGTSVPVYLYREDPDSGVRDFVAAIAPVAIDDRGEALLELRVNPGDPPGDFCLVTDAMLESIPDEIEVGFEHLADPCWNLITRFVVESEVLAPGLFCRDVAAAGYGYVHALIYWVREGRPDRMDADSNGIPWETVFPPSEVSSVLSFETGAPIPPGAFCRDVASLGYGFAHALAYWVREGAPDRMDADEDGLPCETVYPPSDISGVMQFDQAE